MLFVKQFAVNVIVKVGLAVFHDNIHVMSPFKCLNEVYNIFVMFLFENFHDSDFVVDARELALRDVGYIDLFNGILRVSGCTCA